MSEKNTYIFLLGGIIFLYLFSKDKTIGTNVKTADVIGSTDSVPASYKELLNRFAHAILNFNLTVPYQAVLSVLQMESGTLFKTKQNKDVIGDGGNSIGYMQVSKYALQDVNNSLNTDYTFQDLYNENYNLFIGSSYLNLCYKSALKQNSKSPIWLSFKKYNGGIDETDTSNNTMAVTYANKAFEHYKKFLEIS